METTDFLDRENKSTLKIEKLLLIYFNLVKYSCDTSYNFIFIILFKSFFMGLKLFLMENLLFN